MIPKELRPFFWEIDADSFDPQEYGSYAIGRILELGTEPAIERLQSPAGLAVDGHDQLYITDAQLGAILVYDPKGKFRRYIGNRKGIRGIIGSSHFSGN